MNEPDLKRPSTTEDAPAAPGWAESEFDAIFAGLPRTAAMGRLRGAYLDCLAGIGGRADVEGAHDRCRMALLAGLEAEGVGAEERARLDRSLASLEAEVTART